MKFQKSVGRLHKSFLIGILVLVSLMLASSAKATTYECDSCASCDTLLGSVAVADDIVLLNQSINAPLGDNCMQMSWNDDGITFDCQGFSITGNTADEGEGLFGMDVDTVDSVSILNCDISNFDYLMLDALTDCAIVNNTFHDYRTFYIPDTTGCGFNDNRFTENSAGWGGEYLLEFDNSETQSFWNNTFNATSESIYIGCTGSCNQSWNQTGYGNRWLLANGLGFSQTCTDANDNGICDMSYAINGDSNNVDYFPIADLPENLVYNCSSCTTCRAVLDAMPSGGTLRLTANIAADDDDCLYVNNPASDITIDCDNYYITGGTFWNNAITTEGETINMTIKDCNLKSGTWVSTLANLNGSSYNFECDSEPSCSDELGIAKSGNTVYFVGDYVSGVGYIEYDASNSGSWDSGVTFDCLGHDIQGYVHIENDNSTLKNCNIATYSPSVLILNSADNCLILNNTFLSQSSHRSIYFGSSAGNSIINNTFEEHDGSMLYGFIYFEDGDSVSNIFYGNTFNATEEKYYVYCADPPNCIGDTQSWNSSTYGNGWLLYNNSGFSQTCLDGDVDGVCDSPYSFNWDEGEEIFGVIDYLPLFFGEYPIISTTIQLTIHQPQNTTYPTGNLDFNATTNATAVAICLSADGNLTYPICSYNTSALSGYVAAIVAGFYNFTFRANNTLGEYDWDTVFFTVLAPVPPTPSNPLKVQLQGLVEFLVSLIILFAAVFYGVNEMMKEKPDMERMMRVALVILIMIYITAAIYQSTFLW